MHIVGIAQSFGLFLVVSMAMAAVLSLAMVALARMERATVPARRPTEPARRPTANRAANRSSSALAADRVSSPGSCTYGPRTR